MPDAARHVDHRARPHGDHGLGAGIVQLVPELVRGVERVDVHLRRAGPVDAEHGDREREDVRHHHRDAVAALDPELLLQPCRDVARGGVDLDQALTYAQRAKQKLPNNADVADTLGWVYIKKNLSDDAIKIFRDLLQNKPDHVTWRYHLAIALFQKGDKLQAKKELETAMKNSPRQDEMSKIKELMGRIG